MYQPRQVQRRSNRDTEITKGLFDALKYGQDERKNANTNSYQTALAANGSRNAASAERNASNNESYKKSQIELQTRAKDLSEAQFTLKRDQDIVKKLSQQFSPVYDPDGSKFRVFTELNDSGKELMKHLQKSMPEQFDENGKLILMTSHDLIKGQLEDKQAALQSRIPFLQEKLSNPNLDPEQKAQLSAELKQNIRDASMFAKYKNHDLFAAAINATMQDPRLQANPSLEEKLIGEHYSAFKQAETNAMGGEAPTQVEPQGFFGNLGAKADSFFSGVGKGNQAIAPAQKQGVEANQSTEVKTPPFKRTA